MMNSSNFFRVSVAVAVLAGAVACDPGEQPLVEQDDVAQKHQGLVPDFPCEAGKVGWRFGPPNPNTSEGVSAGASPFKPTPPPTMTVKEVRCDDSGIFYTLKAAEECNGQNSCILRASCLANEGLSVRWACSGTEGERTASYNGNSSGRFLASFSCPVPPPSAAELAALATSKVACIPAKCGATAKRGPDMECVSDLSRPVVEQGSGLRGASMEFTVPFRGFERQHVARRLAYGWDKTLDPTKPLGVNFADYVDANWMLFPNGVYKLNGATLRYKPNATLTRPKGRVVLYLVDQAYQVDATGEVIDLRPVESFRCVLHSFVLDKYGEGTPAGNGYSTIAIDQEKFMVPTDCANENFLYRHRQIGAAKAGLTDAQYKTNYAIKGSRLAAAFDLENTTVFVPFGMTQENACAANPVDWYYRPAHKAHDLLAYYDQRGIDAYSSTNRRGLQFGESNRTELGLTEATVRQTEVRVRTMGALRGSVRVDYDWYLAHDKYKYWSTFGMANHGTKMVVRSYLVPSTSTGAQSAEPPDGYFVLGEKEVFRADGIGVTASVRHRVTTQLRDALSRAGSPLEIGATGRRSFEILNCIEVRNVEGGLKRRALSAGGVHDYRLEVGDSKDPFIPPNFSAPGPGCRWSRTPVQFRLDKAIEPLDPLSEDDWSGESDPQAAGDDKMSQEHGGDSERNCGTNDAGTPTCNLVTANEQRGEGLGGAQYLTLDTRSDVDTGQPYAAGAAAELLGYTVLDDEDEKAWEGPGQTVAISFTPEWESLRQWADSNFPEFEWKTGRYSGIMGLGVGWGLKIPVVVGPVQVGVVVFTITMGFSVELTVTYTAGEEYPCLNQGSRCAKMMDAAKLRDAITKCYATGGRLGELSSANEAAAVKQALSSDGAAEAWLGAQVANEYPTPACADTWFQGTCAASHITRHRWLSNDEDFATSTGFNVATWDPLQIFSTVGTGVDVPYLGKPGDRGVALESSGALHSSPMDESKKSVCVYEDAVSDASHSVKTEIKLGAAVGFTLAFCTPSDEAGLCLEGSINVLSAGITPSIQYTYHRLKDAQARTAVRSNVKLSVDWEFKILEGAIDVKLVFGPFALKYNLVTFNGVKLDKDVAGGNLIELNYPTLGAFK